MRLRLLLNANLLFALPCSVRLHNGQGTRLARSRWQGEEPDPQGRQEGEVQGPTWPCSQAAEVQQALPLAKGRGRHEGQDEPAGQVVGVTHSHRQVSVFSIFR